MRSVDTFCIRFDDLSPGGAGSFGLAGKTDSFVATRPEEVASVLQAAEAAARAGYWVAGFVTYEAAAGLNPVLTVRPAGLHDPMRDLPLAHFEAFSEKVVLPDVRTTRDIPGAYNVSGWTPDETRKDYRDSLAITGRAIMAGEIERGKHTFRLHAAFNGDPFALYRDLLLSQRGPYGACIDVGRFHLVSVSPERFFKVEDNILTVRPVLDSVRRGRWQEEDMDLAALLSARGDLSYSNHVLLAAAEAELAKLGDLLPPEESPIVSLDRLELLWHLTARIGVNLRSDISLQTIFQNLYPPLAVTGVPRQEAMEYIAITEDTPRGAYCGAIGFLAPPDAAGPAMSFSVAVRTVVLDQEEGVAEYGVGGAITNASSVTGAYEEARLKAKVLVDRRPEFHLVERFRVLSGEVERLDSQLEVLAGSARYFGFDLSWDQIMLRLKQDAIELDDGILELRVGRDGAIAISEGPAPAFHTTDSDAPTTTGLVAAHRVRKDNVFLFHKTSDPRMRDLLSRHYPEVGVVILINDDGQVAGSLDGNVVARIDGRWQTPPRKSGNPLYAFRVELLDNGDIDEALLTVEDLERADRLAVIDDVAGWRLVDI